MRLSAFCFAVFFVFVAGWAFASDPSEIELEDGSTLLADVVSLEGDYFTLRSDSLGTFQMKKSKIRNIRMSASRKKPPGTTAVVDNASVPQSFTDENIKDIQSRMLTDRGSMEALLSLQDDPDFRAVMEDPEVLQAVNSGDISALMANPKIQKLMNKSEVRDIGGKSLK